MTDKAYFGLTVEDLPFGVESPAEMPLSAAGEPVFETIPRRLDGMAAAALLSRGTDLLRVCIKMVQPLITRNHCTYRLDSRYRTTPRGLWLKCRHDHCIKHQHGWTYQRLPDGTSQWTTRLGHTYITNQMPETGYQKPDT